MKTIVLVLIVCLALILRLNLPENNDIQNDFDDQQSGIIDEMKAQILNTDFLADWTYTDYLFVKFACSENLQTRLIGLPFKKWDIHERDLNSCE